MKKIIGLTVILVLITSCGGSDNGELTGVPGREKYFEPDPYGMVFIPQGSFNMGPSDQDVPWAENVTSKTVTVEAFWMDETEITNNEYRQFVYWVRDSIIRRMLAAQIEDFAISEDQFGNPIDPPYLNWETKIDYKDEEVNNILQELYLPPNERFFGRKELDTRKLMYEYYWIDLQQAANKNNRYNFQTKQYQGQVTNPEGQKVDITNRSAFVFRDVINVYPDTLCWVADFTYSYNEPMTTMYFWHPAYDNYPVVGVTWKQATAFCIWRTKYLNDALQRDGRYFVHDYRLPTESEWEYAARGGLDLSMYPWGGMYTRNYKGCFLANFKPLRGNYADDGGVTTMKVGSFEPNEWGLYDMAGNVAEWTANAYDESAYIFTHDLNPDYKYNAKPDDPPSMKRKVIRGGSWKDIAYYLQCGTRSYEYQDTAKSYIGFRCVRTYLGSNK
ncbi:MAG TPA: SUMF1/EgtB/PvdO family nonheme iron enzyme [Bacteroidales bacterium]|nr:SUMF1/EgtB/PvdO family nonheme iron enzyme [Bacteroidales bacterium]HQK37006.1 SUMF1/EgtB/PvdO family nonheme iron enzyme [Bacteroidales bacterium]